MPSRPKYAGPRHLSRSLLCSTITAALLAAATGAAHAQASSPTVAEAPQSRHPIDLAAQPLPEALVKLSAQTGLQVLYSRQEPYGITAPAVRGNFSPVEALERLLRGSGLTWRRTGPNAVTLERAGTPNAAAGRADGVIVTDALTVAGSDDATGAERDIRGYDNVYDLDLSTSYIGRAEVERYKGATPSDLLNGVPGVFSGDARNSGALDINIRGIQGPGRVPVLIDGGEQALTVWRGYNGATNRNYIDPNLIGGIQIVKGPAPVRNVNTGIGGAMVVNTLDVDDVLDTGQTFGGEFKLEGSSNAVDPRLPTLHTGKDYRDVEGYPQTVPAAPYTDRTLMVTPESGGGGYNAFAGDDYAYRLALGWRPAENVDVLAAYAYRDRGNYFSGQHDADYYSNERSSSADDYIRSMANYWRPGDEVPNTSNRMESWLFKAGWRPGDDQALQLGYRKSLSLYGEIMPSRIVQSNERGGIQWPLSRVDAEAWNLEYKWRPQGSRWIDLYANLWRTDTLSDTYTAGGFPNYAQGDPEFGFDPIIRNTALANANSGRNGITLSNKFRLADTLDLTVGGNVQHEKLRSNDEYFGVSDGWRMYPRAGRREEWNADFDFEWRPVDFLTVNAGARHASYWAFDDFLAAHEGQIRSSVTSHYALSYQKEGPRPQEEIDAEIALYRLLGELGVYPPELVELLIADIPRTAINTYDLPDWRPDGDGNYSRATNACLNGALDGVEGIVGNCRITGVGETIFPTAEKRRDRGWTPHFSATLNFSDYSRAYFRYSEALRFPSMFESTLGFSASLNPWDLKPEHAYNWELAYVHDLGHLLGGDAVADVKLAYYVHKTRDVIERNGNFKFDNIDKQTIRGLDLQGRYDNGRFFTDLAVNYQLENEVCDESTAVLLQTQNGVNLDDPVVLPNCVDYGFVGGYLLTQSTPELSAAWSLGGRFLERRLEIGARASYFKQYENADLEYFRENSYQGCIGSGQSAGDCTGRPAFIFNVPFSWGRTLLLDAYADYRIRDDVSATLTVTNLTDQYYVDPATRSPMAAPGRTLKLSLTARF